jgi:DNA repair exonuclease SbcCD ATPase subunit
MRLHSITLEGFRGFVRKATISLDADVIVCHGPNGAGKTSLLDGILWALSGDLDRLGGSGSAVSLYAREGIARVELTLRSDDRLVTITRVTGRKDQLRLTDGDTTTEGAEAQARLIALILPHLSDRTDAGGAVSRILTRGVYLQQDLIRQFIDTDTAAQRFSLISEIIGAGVVLDLQNELERSGRAWSHSTNVARKEELQPLQLQLAKVQETLGRLETVQHTAPTSDVQAEAEGVFKAAIELLGTGHLSVEFAPTSASELDRLLKELTAQRMAFERDLTIARGLLEELKSVKVTSLDELRAALADTERREVDVSDQLREVEREIGVEIRRLQDERQKQVLNAERSKRLAAMAQVALHELGETCPVCTQTYDKHVTEAHLRALIEHVGASSEGSANDDQLKHLQERETQGRERRNELLGEIAKLRARLSELEAQQTLFRTRLADLGIDGLDQAESALSDRATGLTTRLERITEILSRGERLGLAVVRLGEERQRQELLDQKADLQRRIAQLQTELDAQDRTRSIAGRIIEGLRRASIEVTARQVQSLAPLLQRIYSRIDPHPTFKVTQIVTELDRGKGLLQAGILDPELDDRMHDVGPIFSSSQLNSFAVSLFLALNLGIRSLRLGLSILDDPLQSLDAINLLGLVDVLRRLRERRQIIVSTHDDQLYGLLQRKLRPATEREKLIVVRFERWSKDGPEFRELPFDYDAAANPRVLLAA